MVDYEMVDDDMVDCEMVDCKMKFGYLDCRYMGERDRKNKK